MKKYLVTGGAGYIGSHVVRALLDAGHMVRVFDDLSTGNENNIDPRADFIKGSILDKNALESALQNIDGVFHFAAKLIVPESVEKPAEYYDTNVTGSLYLFKAMRAVGVTDIVFSSTAVVYDETTPQPLQEDAPKKPMNPYGWSKYMGEQILHDIARSSSLRFVVLRYFNVAGKSSWYDDTHTTETHLVPLICEVAQGKKEMLSVYGNDYDTRDGSCIRDYVHIDDIVRAHIAAFEYLNADGQSTICNIGTNTGTTVFEMIAAAQEAYNKEIPYIVKDRRKGDPAILIADIEKAKNLFSWEPEKKITDLFL